MPHTPQDRRPVNSTTFSSYKLDTKADLTAAIFDLQLRFLDQHEVSYQQQSDAIAAADDAKDEIKRLIRDPYEGHCIAKNGSWILLDKYNQRIAEKFQGNKNA